MKSAIIVMHFISIKLIIRFAQHKTFSINSLLLVKYSSIPDLQNTVIFLST